MSETKFSEGPWEAPTKDFGMSYNTPYVAVFDAWFRAVAHVMVSDSARRRDIKEWEANAHLIAASPDLYAALLEAINWDGTDDEGIDAVWLEQARAVPQDRIAR